MPWRDNTSRSAAVSRILAIVIVMMWSVVPAYCSSAAEIGPEHLHVGLSHEHGEGPVHKDSGTCCGSLASAKVLTVAPAALPPIKVVPVSIAAAPITQDTSAAVLDSRPARVATGPPRTTFRRFLSYSPLAPPARAI